MRSTKKFLALSASAVCGAAVTGAILSRAATGFPSAFMKAPPISVPALSNMSGLERAATARDGAVAAAAAPALDALTDSAGAPPGMAPGSADMERFRVLLDNLGSGRHSIFAVPTSGGRVCGGLTGGPSGCLQGFTAAGPVDYSVGDVDTVGSGEATIVWGLAPDSVRSVHVVAGGTRYLAVMGKNAYFFEASAASLAPSAVSVIVLDFKDGRSQSVPVTVGATTTH